MAGGSKKRKQKQKNAQQQGKVQNSTGYRDDSGTRCDHQLKHNKNESHPARTGKSHAVANSSSSKTSEEVSAHDDLASSESLTSKTIVGIGKLSINISVQLNEVADKNDDKFPMKSRDTGKIQNQKRYSGRSNDSFDDGERVHKENDVSNNNKKESHQVGGSNFEGKQNLTLRNPSGEWDVEVNKLTTNKPKDILQRMMSKQREVQERQREHEEFKEFEQNISEIKSEKVVEKQLDLFCMSGEYSLGHCVAQDLLMGRGIAVEFRHHFGRLDELLEQNQEPGGLAVLQFENRYIYYLVTKKLSTGKPTKFALWLSLKKMKRHILDNDVKKLALPKIGCGLDNLPWYYVKSMLEHIFRDVDLELVVCKLEEVATYHVAGGDSIDTVKKSTDTSEDTLQESAGSLDDAWDDTWGESANKDMIKEDCTQGSLNDEDDYSYASDPNSKNNFWESFENTRKGRANYNDSDTDLHRTKVNTDSRNRKPSNVVVDSFHVSSSQQKNDAEFSKYERNMRDKLDVDYKRVIEIEGDLFEMSEEYALGHCVAEDLNMGSGIAVRFRQSFKNVSELLDQRQRQGGLAVLNIDGRYIYYLITKRISSGKPTYWSFWNSLQRMKDHVTQNNVKKLALPRIGCGLDGLEWLRVKNMLEYIFTNVDVEITICNFQQVMTEEALSPGYKKQRKCKVVNDPRVITSLEDYSIIIYLGSEDGYVTDEIRSLDKKFGIEKYYKDATRAVGETVRTEHNQMNYILYGFIIKKKKYDLFSYTNFQKCLNVVQKLNRKDKYEYVGIQAFEDKSDNLVMSKIVNLMRNSLTHVDIYICWPPELEKSMPKS